MLALSVLSVVVTLMFGGGVAFFVAGLSDAPSVALVALGIGCIGAATVAGLWGMRFLWDLHLDQFRSAMGGISAKFDYRENKTLTGPYGGWRLLIQRVGWPPELRRAGRNSLANWEAELEAPLPSPDGAFFEWVKEVVNDEALPPVPQLEPARRGLTEAANRWARWHWWQPLRAHVKKKVMSDTMRHFLKVAAYLELALARKTRAVGPLDPWTRLGDQWSVHLR